MEKFLIRPAVVSDCEAMIQLIKELAVFEKEPESVTVTMDHFREAGFGANPVWYAFVAEVQGKITGMALYYIRYSTWKGKRIYLEDLVVNEAYRGMGIGKALLQQLIYFAKQNGYSGMMWQVLDWNTNAIEFYKQFDVAFDGEWINCTVNF